MYDAWGGLDTNYLTRGRFSAGNIGILTLVKSQMLRAHLLTGRRAHRAHLLTVRSRKLSAKKLGSGIMKTREYER